MDYNKANKLTKEAQSIVKNMKSQIKERTKHHIGRFAKIDTKSFPRLYYAIDSLFDEYIADLKYIKVLTIGNLAKEQKKVLAKYKEEEKKKSKKSRK